MSRIPTDDRRRGLAPPRFTLSTMLWVVAVICVLLTALKTVGPYGAFALMLLFMVLFAHISGNAIGTYLRDNGSQPIGEDGQPLQKQKRVPHRLTEDDYAPATKLGQRDSLGLTVLITTAVGTVVGAVGGGTLLILVNWSRITIPAVMLAVIFSAILGGFAGFLTSSLVHVMIGAHIQALRHSKGKRDRAPITHR